MIRHSLILLFALLLPQELDKPKKEFNEGVAALDRMAVRRGAESLARTETKEAVDIILEGYSKLASLLKTLGSDKQRFMHEMDENADFEMRDARHVSEKGTIKYNKFRAAEAKAGEVEQKILSVDAVKREMVAAFSLFKSEKTIAQLIEKLASAKDNWQRRAGIAEGMGAIESAAVVPALVATLDAEKDLFVRIACIDSLRARKPKAPEALSVICAQLKDEYWQVKSAALHAIRAIGLPETRFAVPALIEAIQGAEGRLRYDLNDLLVDLTLVNRHGDYNAWKAWLDQNGDAYMKGTFKPGSAESSDNAAAGATVSSYYGIPVKSKCVIFILDRSASMLEPAEWKVAEDVQTAGAKKDPAQAPESGPKREGDRKIDIARWQLKRCIYNLPEGTDFNIIFFNHGVEVMSEKMVRLTSSTRQSAMDYINRMPPESGTNIFDALEKAFSFAGTGLQDKLVKSSVDTIYLMTDGVPSAGRIQSTEDITQKVRTMNKLKKIEIHTIGLFTTLGGGSLQPGEAEDGTRFLRQLAEENGGKFVDGKPQK